MPPSSTPAGPPCLALRTTCGRGVAVDRWPLPLPVPHSAPVVGSPPRGTSVLPPLWKTTRAPTTLFHFGALSRGLRARCLRFAVRLATAHARLACRWWPAFRCAGLVTRRAPSKFQPFTSWHPLLQAWPGAISMETSPDAAKGLPSEDVASGRRAALLGLSVTYGDVHAARGGAPPAIYLPHLRAGRSPLDAPTRVLSRCPNSRARRFAPAPRSSPKACSRATHAEFPRKPSRSAPWVARCARQGKTTIQFPLRRQ